MVHSYRSDLNNMEKESESTHPVDYKWYKNLSKDEKQRLVGSKQQERFRKPKPIEGLSFSEENFVDLTVTETESFLWQTVTTQIKLATYRQKSALKQIKAVVALFHGLTSHTNEGIFIARKLTEVGYEVVGFDQRGFGKSEGRRGYIEDVKINMDDAEQFVSKIREMYKDTSIYLLGLSMGGLLAFNLGLRHPEWYKGLILMAPALRSYYGSAAIYVTKFLSFIYPYMQLPKGKGGKHGSKNPNVSESRKQDTHRYTADPYANTLKCVLDGMKQSQQHYSELSCQRLLLIQGARDNSVDPEGIIELYEKCKCKDRQILLYPNLWHNIWQEEEIYDIVPRLIEWLEKEHE